MDQIKIGEFIAERRLAAGLTQAELAARLHVTDRAISKWENGRGLPDVSLMPALCESLGICLDELFCGEALPQTASEQREALLLELAEQKIAADKQLLRLEILIGCLGVFVVLSFTLISGLLTMPTWARITLILLGALGASVSVAVALQIEQQAGYYECKRCHHRYVPTYNQVLWAAHMGRSRHMRCPACHQRSWHKKVLKKD
jgi:transcriptional regulator with XRE-family HTH domain